MFKEVKMRGLRNKINPAYEQARANALFLSIGEGAIATDEEGMIRRINQVALDTLGYKKEEVVGEWFPKIIVAQDERGRDIDLFDRPMTLSMMTGKPVSRKIFYKTKDGSRIPVWVTVSPIMLSGKPIGAIEVFRDITRDHEVDRMKSDFISIASHQLRTPLAAIKTYTHMLSDGFSGKLSREQQELVKVVLGSVDRMNEIINTLLNVSRIESGTIKVESKLIDVVKLIQGLNKELINAAAEKGIKIHFSYPASRVMLPTDPLLFTEICANLITNAIKYTPHRGKVNITLKTKGKGVVVEVADTGYGIPKALHGNVFSKFFRAPNIVQYEASGNGLGLYLAKHLAETLNGKLWFKSTEDKGTTFYFACPPKL